MLQYCKATVLVQIECSGKMFINNTPDQHALKEEISSLYKVKFYSRLKVVQF